jgi:thiosulfate/3-mercaptopyruvate sulfurtransferase
MKDLVSTQWLAYRLSDEQLCILDCSWHLPSANRNAYTEFESLHIPGAHFFDLDAISDTDTTLPHMLPTPEKFASKVGGLGINNQTQVICYDSLGLFSAARTWWMFKIFGHDNVAVLDGGLKKWLVENRSTIAHANTPIAKKFAATFRPHMVKSIAQVATEKSQIVDARSPTRFRGEEQEPRPGVSPGHVPGAKNLHYSSLLKADGTMKPIAELSEIFNAAGIDVEKPITTSCGSGVTAAILTLVLAQLGAKNHALYDGSWAEWGSSGQEIELG